MRKKLLIAGGVLLLLVLAWMVGSGFSERTDVYLADYSLSDDGAQLTLEVGVAGSMGYTRGFRDSGGGVKPHYLTFYSAFGGFNSAICAENTFVLELAPEDSEIWFNREGGGFVLVLQKDEESGEWIRP